MQTFLGRLRSGWTWTAAPAAFHTVPLAPRDAGNAAAIHAAAFARGWDLTDLQAMIADRAVLSDGLFRGASDGASGRLLGIVLSRIVLDEAEILTIALAPAARGHGGGRVLLRAHLEELDRRGVRTVFLEVEDGNAPARRLYARAGFTQIGRREAYYARSDGTRAAALTMQRRV